MPIVAAVDRSERVQSVIEKGREFADLYGVELHAVHVRSQAASVEPGHLGGATPVVDTERIEEEAAEIATEAVESVEGSGESVAVGLVGNPAQELIRYSDERDAECIVVSGRKRSPWGQALFGSVTQSLLLNADRPVVAVMHREE